MPAMQLADEIRAISKDHMLAESPLGTVVEKAAIALEELDARVRCLEIMAGRTIADLNDFELQRLEEAKRMLDPPVPSLFDRTEP